MRNSLLVFSLGVVLAGCGSGETVDAFLARDFATTVNCVLTPDDPRCTCMSDDDCKNSMGGPRCDLVAGKCVTCLPVNDNCTNGQVCQQINGVWTCTDRCAGNADCQKIGGGSLCCGGICVNPANDVKNCGACSSSCPPVANGSPGCAQGTCIVAACNPGFDDCDKAVINGCEVETAKDPANCGACNNACKPFANGLPTCTAGKCSAICAPGFADCDNDTNTGCEVDTTFDTKNCGGCGKLCAAVPNADPACDQGKCGFRCKPGFADCDGNPANGCEVNNNNDGNNCGHCGNICPLRPNSMAASCTNGQCINTCNAGFGDCDNNSNNGCEADLNSSLAACGACGKPCKNQNAVATCSKGVCSLQCAAGYQDCNMDGKDGCEANLLTDNANCGGCGMACPQNNPCCKGGVCGNQCFPPACTNDKDQTGSNFVICFMNNTGAWMSANNNGGGCTYAALALCQKYGFSRVTRWGGTCGTICGYCGAFTCQAPQGQFALGGAYTNFDSGGGNPQGGANISCTVHWECAP